MANLANVYPNEYKEEPRYELIDGVIVLMSPRPSLRHIQVIRSIFNIFNRYLKKGKSCEVFFEGLDVNLTKDNTFIPDLIVVCNKDIIKSDGIYGAPDLVVEVLSPTTSGYDRGHKKYVYGKSGVKEYWIVDTNNYSVEVYLPQDGRLELDDIYTIIPAWMLKKMEKEGKEKPPYNFKTTLFDDLIINIEEVFEDILPDDY
jgi:Uma2 family endonuclease